MLYFVDDDRIISIDEGKQLINEGYIIDMKYHTIMSDTLNKYVLSYANQDFPPAVPDTVDILPVYDVEIDKIKNSSAVLIVNDQESSVMEDIGSVYNESLGIWIVDAIALKTLRERKKQKTNGKIHMKSDRCGTLAEIYGDVTQYVSLIKEIGGTYDEDKDIWYVPIASVNKILHIIN